MAEKFKVGDMVTTTAPSGRWPEGEAKEVQQVEDGIVRVQDGPFAYLSRFATEVQLAEAAEEVQPADLEPGDEVRITVRGEYSTTGDASGWIYLKNGSSIDPTDIVKVERLKKAEPPKTTVTLELSKEQLDQLTSLAGGTYIDNTALYDVYNRLRAQGGRDTYGAAAMGGVIRLTKK